MKKKYIIITTVAAALLIIALVSYNAIRSSQAGAPQPMGRLQFEIRTVDRETGVVSEPLKATKLSIVNMKGDGFQAEPGDRGIYRSAELPIGKYFVTAETKDGYTGKYLLDSSQKDRIASLKLYPREMAEAIAKNRLYKDADFNIDSKAYKLTASESYMAFSRGEKSTDNEQPFAIIPVGARLLAQDNSDEFKAVAYTNSQKDDARNAVSMIEVYRNTAYIGQYQFDYGFVTGMKIMDVDGDLNEEIVVATKHYTGSESRARLYIFEPSRKNFTLQKIGDQDYLELDHPEIYLGENIITIISNYRETYGRIQTDNRMMIQTITWKEEIIKTKTEKTDDKPQRTTRTPDQPLTPIKDPEKEKETVTRKWTALLKENITDYRLPEYKKS